MKSLLILSALIASTSAAAQPVEVIADAPRIERVAFADLDLTSDAGVRRLEARIHSAANRLCIEDGVQPLSVKLDGKACFNAAYADGLTQAGKVIQARRSSLALASTAISIQAR